MRGFYEKAERNKKTAYRQTGEVNPAAQKAGPSLRHERAGLGPDARLRGPRLFSKNECRIRLKESFRDSDIIARIGGDEFALLAIGTDGINPEYLTARLMKNINAHNARAKRRFKISVSIGLSSFSPDHPCSIDELILRADKLMYKQKKLKQLL